MKIKNIFFDLCEVFYYGIYGHGAMGNLVAERLGISIDEYCEKDTGESWELWKKLNCGQVREEDYWQKLIEIHDWKATPQDFIQCSRDALKVEVPGTLQVVGELRLHKYNLFLVSDLWPELRDAMLTEHPWIRQVFSECYFSCNTGYVKSSPGYFEKVCKSAGAKPEESLFIDDYYVNVDNAKAIGMQGIVFENSAQLRTELERELGILRPFCDRGINLGSTLRIGRK